MTTTDDEPATFRRRPKNGYPVPLDIPDDETVVLVVSAGWIKWLDRGSADMWSWDEADRDPEFGRRFIMDAVPTGRRCFCGHWESEHDMEADPSACGHGWSGSHGCLCTEPVFGIEVASS
jgi:hypothetical protein